MRQQVLLAGAFFGLCAGYAQCESWESGSSKRFELRVFQSSVLQNNGAKVEATSCLLPEGRNRTSFTGSTKWAVFVAIVKATRATLSFA